ncbi:MAG TPA: glycosyltransferase family 4 protein [Bryobacteraceae bacterium]|nr:glycosyltransferase family 4 protein [Bryobacteraceae bacterium]
MLHVLVAHNYYRHPGGEDAVYEATGSLLEARGNRVTRFTAHNDATASMSRPALAKAALWNRDVRLRLRATMRAGRPNVAHFMNTFPLISPAAYYTARDEGVPVVQTLHNYRLFCVNGLLFHEGRVCEDCAGKSVSWHGAVRGCYHNSRAASAVAAAVSGFHRLIGTWSAEVDIYIALTEFARRKFLDCGLPASKVVVHPNFLHNDPGSGTGAGGYALFAGRLSAEKGLSVLLDAWQKLGGKTTLKIAGEGPLAAQAASQSRKSVGIEYLGPCSSAEILALMRDAAFLVLPSECYEGLPMAIVEAFASGLPVIAAGHGSMSTLIDHGRTGLHFRPGDSEDLAANLQWAFSHPAVLARMRTEARAEFEALYTAEKHYRGLVEIYERAMSGN